MRRGVEAVIIHLGNQAVSQLPRHEPIKKVYVEMVKEIVESEAMNNENA